MAARPGQAPDTLSSLRAPRAVDEPKPADHRPDQTPRATRHFRSDRPYPGSPLQKCPPRVCAHSTGSVASSGARLLFLTLFAFVWEAVKGVYRDSVLHGVEETLLWLLFSPSDISETDFFSLQSWVA